MVTIGEQQGHILVTVVCSSLGIEITLRLDIIYQASPIKQTQHRREIPMSLAVTYLATSTSGNWQLPNVRGPLHKTAC